MADSMLKLALLVSIAGLVLLASLAYFIGPTHIELSELDSYSGKTVVVRGEIVSVAKYSEVAFLKLGEEQVKVVLFDILNHTFAKGDVVEVRGEVTRYKRELEIIAEEVKCIKCLE